MLPTQIRQLAAMAAAAGEGDNHALEAKRKR